MIAVTHMGTKGAMQWSTHRSNTVEVPNHPLASDFTTVYKCLDMGKSFGVVLRPDGLCLWTDQYMRLGEAVKAYMQQLRLTVD